MSKGHARACNGTGCFLRISILVALALVLTQWWMFLSRVRSIPTLTLAPRHQQSYADTSSAVGHQPFVAEKLKDMHSLPTTPTESPIVEELPPTTSAQSKLKPQSHKVKTSKPTSTSKPHGKPLPTPTTIKKKQTKQLAPSGPIDAKFVGVDLVEQDHAEHANPGGTEEEAKAERRELDDLNWPLKKASEMAWRKRTRREVPVELTQLQRIDSTDSLEWDTAVAACEGKRSWGCLWKHYRPSLDQDCEKVYGSKLLDRFRKQNEILCQGEGVSSLQCKEVRASKEHNIDTSICEGQRVVVDLSKIDDGDFPWLNFHKGTFRLQCQKQSEATDKWEFMHCQKDWMELGFQAQKANTAPKSKKKKSKTDSEPLPTWAVDMGCDALISTPTYFVTRSGDYSPFAVTHDWLNSVLLYSVVDMDPKNVSVVIMDRMTVGFYTPIWQMLFSPSHKLLWYPDLEKGKVRCYEKMWFNIPARLSPIYNHDSCGPSSLYRLYRDLVLHAVDALYIRSPPDYLVVTMIVRRNYNTGHSIGRRIPNGHQLVEEMRKLSLDKGESDGEAEGSALKVIVNEIDYADYDFDQQLPISRATDVIVAMHGAGLAQMMFMPPYGGAFEFFCPEKPSSNYRYEQLSKRMGLSYDSFSIENSENIVPIPSVLPQLQKLFRKVAKAKVQYLKSLKSTNPE